MIIESIANALTNLLMPVNNALNSNIARYTAPQPQQTVYSASRPQPPQTLSPAVEINNIQMQLGLPPLTLTDKEAMMYLPKSRKALEEFRKNRQIDQVGYQKLNQGIVEQNQKQIQKEQLGKSAYDMEQNRREANSRMVRQTHDNAEKPYLDYLNQIQDIQNKMHVPFPPIKFG